MKDKQVRVYADGVYDFFHSGHAKQLKQAKTRYPNTYLIVGVSPDEEVHRLKGPTLCNEVERVESVRQCKWVDEIIFPCPWVLTKEFLEKHNIDFVAHDALPYASSDGTVDIYQEVKKMGKFLETERTEGISTSDLTMKLIRNRDQHMLHLLQNGYTREDLNITIFTEIRLNIQSFLQQLNICQKRKTD